MIHKFEVTIETSDDLSKEEIELLGINILEGLNIAVEEVGLTPNVGYTRNIWVNHTDFSEPLTLDYTYLDHATDYMEGGD